MTISLSCMSPEGAAETNPQRPCWSAVALQTLSTKHTPRFSRAPTHSNITPRQHAEREPYGQELSKGSRTGGGFWLSVHEKKHLLACPGQKNPMGVDIAIFKMSLLTRMKELLFGIIMVITDCYPSLHPRRCQKQLGTRGQIKITISPNMKKATSAPHSCCPWAAYWINVASWTARSSVTFRNIQRDTHLH